MCDAIDNISLGYTFTFPVLLFPIPCKVIEGLKPFLKACQGYESPRIVLKHIHDLLVKFIVGWNLFRVVALHFVF